MSHTPTEPTSLTAEIMQLLSQVTDRFEPGESEMRQWLLNRAQTPAVVDLLEDMTIMMLRVLEAIGKLEPVNGITISKEFRIPKGSVSKITRRLIDKKLLRAESLPNNKKEILFRLTPLGRELFLAHRAFDQQMERGFLKFMQRYDDNELSFLVKVLQDVMGTSFLELGNPVPSANEAPEP